MNFEGPSSNFSYDELEAQEVSFSKVKKDQASKPRIQVTESVKSLAGGGFLQDTVSNKENAHRLLNNLFNQMAVHIRNRSDRRKFSKNYYHKRKSFNLALIEDGEQSARVEHRKVYAADDGVVDLDTKTFSPVNKGRQEEQKRKETVTEEGLNAALAEMANDEALMEHITNPKTREFIHIRLRKEGLRNYFQNEDPDFVIPGSPRAQDKKGTTKQPDLEMKVKKPAGGKQTSTMPNLKFSKTGFESPLRDSKGILKNGIEARSISIAFKGKITPKSFISNASPAEISRRLEEYLPIFEFLALAMNLFEVAANLAYCDSNLSSLLKIDFNLNTFLSSEPFLERLLKVIMKYRESTVFTLMLNHIPNWDVLFSEKLIGIFIEQNYVEYLVELLQTFNQSSLKRVDSPTTSGKKLSVESAHLLSKDKEAQRSHSLSQGKLNVVLRLFLEASETDSSDELILEFLRNLGCTAQNIYDLLLNTRKESRVLDILSKHKELAKCIDPSHIIETRMFSLLSLVDTLELINIFNMSTVENKSSSKTIYYEVCEQIKEGHMISSLCNLLLNINPTFWDFDKLWRFYQVLNDLLRFETNSNWMSQIDNPLLFFMKVANFFLKTTRSLDIDSKEISALCRDLVHFCLEYIENAAEETLILQILEKDSDGLSFFEYTFMAKQMGVLGQEYVTNMIHTMWDLNRSSKQSFSDFFKLFIFQKETKKFSMKVFRKHYLMPIEDSDMFQLEYFLCSRSVYLMILSDLFWPLILLVYEFFFSLTITDLYVNRGEEAFDDSFGWLANLLKESPTYYGFFLTFRISNIVTLILRSMVLVETNDTGRTLKMYYNTGLFLYVIQMVLCPLLVRSQFMVLNILQMLIVAQMVCYAFYLGFSLDRIGVLIRLFARMVWIVVLFALASMVVITLIAYPIHTLFIEFTQEVADGAVLELNMFRSLYNGVLTLFEFVFGAVIFVRPYLEENYYTYAMSFIMVIFSFFGNIMLANILIAFLANQFSTIREFANYYTLRMQFGLTKVLRTKDLDTIYGMPFLLNIPALFLYFLMLKPGPVRRKANLLLRKVIFVVNVVMPTVCYYFIYLMATVIRRYLGAFQLILIESPHSKLKAPLYFFGWMLFGIPFLLKLFCEDLWLLLSNMLNFRDAEEDDLFKINVTSEDIKILSKVFRKIYKVAATIQKKGVKTISIGGFIYEVGKLYSGTFSNGKKEPEEGKIDLPSNKNGAEFLLNKNNYLFRRKYIDEQGIKLYPAILRKYVNYDDKLASSQNSNSEVDIDFIMDRLKLHMNSKRVLLLLSIDKFNFEKAMKVFQATQEIGIKGELTEINHKIDQLTKDLATVFKHVMRTDGKLMQSQFDFGNLTPQQGESNKYRIRINS